MASAIVIALISSESAVITLPLMITVSAYGAGAAKAPLPVTPVSIKPIQLATHFEENLPLYPDIIRPPLDMEHQVKLRNNLSVTLCLFWLIVNLTQHSGLLAIEPVCPAR